jgi:hypothetical protein
MRGGVPCIVMGKAAVSPLTLRMRGGEEARPLQGLGGLTQEGDRLKGGQNI